MAHRLAMIGSGFMGRTWSQAALRVPDCELAGVAVGRRATALAADFGVPKFESMEELLASPDVDVVVISTPPSLHAEHAMAALTAGKHVLLEKPMAWTAAESLALDEAARKAQRQLAVVSHHRFRNSPRTAKRLIDEGAIGDIRMVTASGVDELWDPDEFEDHWKLDSSLMRTFDDWGAHACDLLHWFVGANPVHAFAQSHTYTGMPPGDQSVMSFFRFDSDVMATIWMTYEMPAPRVGSMLQFLIVGSKGSIDLDAYSGVRLGVNGEWTTVYTQPAFDPEDTADGVRLEAFERALQDLFDCIDNGGTPLVNAREGLMTQKMLEAARLSYTTGRAARIDPDPLSAHVELV